MARKPSTKPKRPYVRVTRWRRRRFFLLLAETGTVKVAAELAGLGIGALYRLRKLEPGFRERMEAAIAVGCARLEEAPPPCCAGSMSGSPCPPDMAAKCGALRTRSSPGKPGEEFAGLVPRRGQGGRVRLVSPGQRWWEARHDEIFLRALRGTGNVEAAARAAGFTARTAYNQMKKRPRFAEDCEQAIRESRPRLDSLLYEYAARWSLASAGEAFEGEPLDERDVDRALRTLTYWDREQRKRDARRHP